MSICSLCKSEFINRIDLHCGHAFCGKCISKHMDNNNDSIYRTSCPRCNSPIFPTPECYDQSKIDKSILSLASGLVSTFTNGVVLNYDCCSNFFKGGNTFLQFEKSEDDSILYICHNDIKCIETVVLHAPYDKKLRMILMATTKHWRSIIERDHTKELDFKHELNGIKNSLALLGGRMTLDQYLTKAFATAFNFFCPIFLVLFLLVIAVLFTKVCCKI